MTPCVIATFFKIQGVKRSHHLSSALCVILLFAFAMMTRTTLVTLRKQQDLTNIGDRDNNSLAVVSARLASINTFTLRMYVRAGCVHKSGLGKFSPLIAKIPMLNIQCHP